MKLYWAVGLVLLAASCGLAQDATRIDGRQHPELIPDNAAYRSVFLMHSHFQTQEETSRSEQFHARIGYTAADHQVYDELLRNFRQQYEILMRTHNAFVDGNVSAASVGDLQKEVSETRQSLSRLVEAARTQLASGMSQAGLAKLDAFVQSEKTHMVMGARSAQ
jgi:hypothetical protein